jgi:hypothetical protein
LVPAFDIGVTRGLGDTPDAAAQAKPAWDVRAPAKLILPVYFHWEFATGAAGDFESLARALTPYKVSARVGLERMFVGQSGDGMPVIDPANPAAYLDMDGALRAPSLLSGTLNDVPATLRDGLQQTLNAASRISQQGGAATASPIGPPLYGEWHAKTHTVSPTAPAWFRDLNLDIRSRAAAGLGAEAVRGNQEALAQACWEQVGRIIDANALMSRARLSLEANARAHVRHVASLPTDRLLQMSAPMHERVLHAATTVRVAVRVTSLPNATTDPALRRLTSAQRPALKAAARRAGLALPPSGGVRVDTAKRLASGALPVDPTGFVPSGILGIAGLGAVALPDAADAPVDLSVVGIPVSLASGAVRQLRDATATLAAAPRPTIALRSDIRTVGLVVDANLTRARELATRAPIAQASVLSGIDALLVASSKNPGATAILLTAQPKGGVLGDALDVGTSGQVVIRTPAGLPTVHVASIDPALIQSKGAAVGAMIASLPVGALARDAKPAPAVRHDLVGRVAVNPPTGTAVPIASGGPGPVPIGGVHPVGTTPPVATIPPHGTIGPPVAPPLTVTVLPPVKDPAVIGNFELAFRDIAAKGVVGPTVPPAVFVAFDLTAVRTSIVQRTDPRVVVPARIATMLRVGSGKLLGVPHDRVVVATQMDRVMAYPELNVPASTYLAQLDKSRFLPGVDEIPNDAMTLLETNPRFVEGFLVGLNHEMNRELLWRGFPTDQRGTPFRRFWTWADGGTDIPPIHQWQATAALGATARGIGGGGQIVLLVRGRLLRRYPNTVIYAWRAKGTVLSDPPAAGDVKQPVFGGVLEPDIVYVGFELADVDLTTGDGWFFVLQEQPTEPRFGLDQPPANGGAPPAISTWNDATWAHAGTDAGAYLRIAGNPLANAEHDQVKFVTNSAHLAALTLQRPMRVAVQARQLATLP